MSAKGIKDTLQSPTVPSRVFARSPGLDRREFFDIFVAVSIILSRKSADPLPKDLPDLRAEIEPQAIRAALTQHHGVQTQAAQSLGISERVLRYKMKKYGLESREACPGNKPA
jgi:transcriptional regulator with AAA-type ATPase domain